MLLQLAPTSRALRMVTDDARIERYVQTAYGNLLSDAMMNATDTGIVTTAETPVRVLFNGVPIKREWSGPGTNPWRSGAYIVDQFVWRSLAKDSDWFALYGCAVIVDDRAIVLVGQSGVGKTTLGLALQRLGATLIGDEMVLVNRRTRLVATIDRRLSIRWGANDPLNDAVLAGLIRDNASPIGSGTTGFLALDRRIFGEKPGMAPLAATFVLTRNGELPTVAPVSASRTVLTIAPYLGARPKNLDDIAYVFSVFAHGSCFTVNVGDPNETAEAMLEMMSKC